MKLISLNAWGGKRYDPLIKFIEQHAKNTDIFCFQEIFKTPTQIVEEAGYRLNLYKEFESLLKDHKAYFVSTLENYITGTFQTVFTNFPLSSGLAIFIKKTFDVKEAGDFYVYGSKNSFVPGDLNSLPRNVQYLRFEKNGQNYTICNIHGIWVKGGKLDTESRIIQSTMINNFLEKEKGKKILCGDFNLSINTKSLEMLEKNMVNLIKKYNIQTTRNEYFPGEDKFADYTFVSPNVKVKNFEVPNSDASDHLPMILEFS